MEADFIMGEDIRKRGDEWECEIRKDIKEVWRGTS